jgi:hypothetical protein
LHCCYALPRITAIAVVVIGVVIAAVWSTPHRR